MIAYFSNTLMSFEPEIVSSNLPPLEKTKYLVYLGMYVGTQN